MSRIGNKPIAIPEGVEVTLNGHELTVKGKNGELTRTLNPIIKLNISDDEIVCERPDDSKEARIQHGTTRSVVANMVEGVHEGFQKQLELVGVGYRAQKQGQNLVLNVGLSHSVEFEPEDGIEVEVPKNTIIIVKGASKERVGQFAAKVREVRPPEPYKGKGIKYAGERIRRKEGKTGK
ncbi:50S ribosomal protein L6 [Dolosigranulum pigrum]|uniref:50S ribosomal protein L6 n=1 Tax=Dolosigranulum pigrum TaxID=29394 RepID=UPI000DC23569|nr:50S ribosomal protein L6 [Dolosigranulum pigrum]QTJ56908.1 50S ribosomal protein L6 [Dolosigranulum pigrum]RAN53085.1 50S ribosomal protein L6 [Dolosigranulum pigrum]RAN57543.1 50S ribosomal protein L6 [Dolosigranulum pigrum]